MVFSHQLRDNGISININRIICLKKCSIDILSNFFDKRYKLYNIFINYDILTNNLYGLISSLLPFKTQLIGKSPGSLIFFGLTLAIIAN